MKNNLPITTLFMISSLDGKISSGDRDSLDVDKDWKKIKGVKEGLNQYYKLEQKTDLVSFNTGRVMKKIGINNRGISKNKIPVSFVLIDNEPHINLKGLKFLSSWLKHVFIITTNKEHPVFKIKNEYKNITVIYYKNKINFKKLFSELKVEYSIDKMTIQSGGTMNAILLREGLINKVSLIIAPLLVGGKSTPTLIDGEAVHNIKDLKQIRPLELISVKKLKNSYISLFYKVLN
jgi:2,5-diamino-6-(ribosylamino)-4(3H)-pyrimidinone 5'-phosphate reductase